MAQRMLSVLLASWLAIAAHSAFVAPKDDGGNELPPRPSDDLVQKEILSEDLDLPPRQFMIEQILKGFTFPVLVHGEPQDGPTTAFTYRYKLDEFPPARPSPDNIGNICAEGRKKFFYGPWNLPQTGFSHLANQGKALNTLETSMDQCCQLPSEQEKVPCCSDANPNLAKPNARTDPSRCGDPTEHVTPQVTFPPGEPTEANFNNVCKLRKIRPRYPPSLLRQSNSGRVFRQAQAVNLLEKEFKECCQEGGIAYAHKGWESTLVQYCKQEFSVKTRPHICCKENSQDALLTCFASMAPYPTYNKELTSVNLANITPSLLGSLCGQFTLLTNRKPVPALVQNITQPCCQLEGEERIWCAEEEKSAFIVNLCSAREKTWNDSMRCCAQEGSQARVACFNLNYLNNVALGTVERQVPLTTPAI